MNASNSKLYWRFFFFKSCKFLICAMMCWSDSNWNIFIYRISSWFLFFCPWFMIHSLRDDVVHDSFAFVFIFFLAVIHDLRSCFYPRNLWPLEVIRLSRQLFSHYICLHTDCNSCWHTNNTRQVVQGWMALSSPADKPSASAQNGLSKIY